MHILEDVRWVGIYRVVFDMSVVSSRSDFAAEHFGIGRLAKNMEISDHESDNCYDRM